MFIYPYEILRARAIDINELGGMVLGIAELPEEFQPHLFRDDDPDTY
ncbi:hypothetical protein G6L37_17750 [Agrobacterium rubi]|nr:hypothetical protein [Agrobacterium rubi]NTF08013.1 hypothetical protein [Agrobacterium rubi]NTF20241.1 hypothetical protein [Agrobacterium rubi]NTF27212.1 hypothetical protein [Agrobacterium rubi]